MIGNKYDRVRNHRRASFTSKRIIKVGEGRGLGYVPPPVPPVPDAITFNSEGLTFIGDTLNITL